MKNETFTITVKKVVTLTHTVTVSAPSARAARAVAVATADDMGDYTATGSQSSGWRVESVITHADKRSDEEVRAAARARLGLVNGMGALLGRD